MNTSSSEAAAKLPQVERTLVVALYERESGAIVHMHTVTMFKGGRVVPESEAIATARREAERIGHVVKGLGEKVSARREHAGQPHRIDPATGEFVRQSRPDFKVQRLPPKPMV